MSDSNPAADPADRYRRLLTVLEANLKYLHSAGMDEGVLATYEELLHYLRSRPPGKMAEIIDLGRSVPYGPKFVKSRFTDNEIRAMTAGRVRQIAAEPDIPRRELERIAMIRFGMTKGGLSNLRSRDALIQKLLTLVGHESTHESIVRAVDASTSSHREENVVRKTSQPPP